MSKVYTFIRVQTLRCSPAEAWDFFSDPGKLPDITPPSLDFKVTAVSRPGKMYAGQIIEYIVRPLFKIPLYWMTEITHVRDREFFSDEQRFGPYSFWHHQHHFTEVAGGTQMTDIVHYKIPFWILGDAANTLFVKKQLRQIFDYRRETAEKIFP